MVAVGLGVSFWEPFLCTRAGVVQQKRKKLCKKDEKWKVAVGPGESFWEPFLCTRAGVFQQKRKQGGKK